MSTSPVLVLSTLLVVLLRSPVRSSSDHVLASSARTESLVLFLAITFQWRFSER